jgi:hypothetical protein
VNNKMIAKLKELYDLKHYPNMSIGVMTRELIQVLEADDSQQRIVDLEERMQKQEINAYKYKYQESDNHVQKCIDEEVLAKTGELERRVAELEQDMNAVNKYLGKKEKKDAPADTRCEYHKGYGVECDDECKKKDAPAVSEADDCDFCGGVNGKTCTCISKDKTISEKKWDYINKNCKPVSPSEPSKDNGQPLETRVECAINSYWDDGLHKDEIVEAVIKIVRSHDAQDAIRISRKVAEAWYEVYSQVDFNGEHMGASRNMKKEIRKALE